MLALCAMRRTFSLAALALPLALLAPAPSTAAPATPRAPAAAPAPSLRTQIEALLAQAPAGTRYGLLVTTLDGREILAVDPDRRYIPASNTKVFTTVTAYAQLPALEAAALGTGVRLEPTKGGVSVVLVGHGDSRLSSAADCTTDCLATLADAVAAKTRHVHDVIGDDSWYPDERWSPGMSWNNIVTRDGTGISALTLDDNAIFIDAAPGKPGEPPKIGDPVYYALDNRAVTVPGTGSTLDYARDPNTGTVRVFGTIGADAPAETLRLGIDDPAHYAAWRFRQLLEARGVKVRGSVSARHRPLMPADDPAVRNGAPAARPAEPEMLAQLPSPPLDEDVRTINKVSQNLHAELMLRRVGHLSGSGSIADGQAALRAVMAQAGVPRAGFDFSDGSGMSTYNRISPRAAVTLLGWVARQPWGAAWKDSLPVGGVDGTLRRRFKGSALDGKLFAKTGSLNATSALSGYLVAASGQTLVFSLFANDAPDGQMGAAIATMDKLLIAVAAAQ